MCFEAVMAAAPQDHDSDRIPYQLTDRSSPYKHLDYFEREDSPLFFGREKEIRRLINLVCAHKLVVVTGPSGTGKTSLLNAGLLAWSDRNPPFVGIYSRCGQNPERSVIDAVCAHLGRADGGFGGDDTLLTLLRQSMDQGLGIPIVVLDQAEELFTRFDERLRERFLITIRTCLTSPNLPVRFVLAIRDDFLGRLVDLRSLLPSLLQNTFYVPSLTKNAAIAAIRNPSLLFNVPFDESLAARVFEEIGSVQVAPPQIQIVCDSLFRQRDENGITSTLYDKLGGARSILAEFTEQQIDLLGRRRGQAKEVLKVMVTSEGTKEVLSSAEIARRAKSKPEQVQRILFHLRDTCRLIRTVAEDGELRFELAHEYLTTAIWAWMSQEEKKQREVEELLIKELRSWRHFRSIRLGADRLQRFAEHSNLLELDAESLTLFLLSSITHQLDAKEWVRLVTNMGESVQDQISAHLFAYFRDSDLNQRGEAAEVITQLDPRPLLKALESPTAHSRRVALEMIGGIRLSSAVSFIGHLLDDPDEACRSLACGALGAIGDSEAVRILSEAASRKDLTTVCAAIRALGRVGVPKSQYDTILTALTSGQPALVKSVANAIEYGESPGAVQFIIQQNLPSAACDELWQAIAAMPTRCAPWFGKIISELSNDQLLRARQLPTSNWVGHEVEIEKLRRKLPSEYSGWRAEPKLQILIPPNCSPDLAAKALVGEYRVEAIQELARRGESTYGLLKALATNTSARVRAAFLEILIKQGETSDRAIRETQGSNMALNDEDPTVRSIACQLAANLKLWSVLETVLLSDRNGKARSGALRGLTEAPLNIIVNERVVRDCMKSSEPAERYWACLFTKERNLIKLSDTIRTLVYDDTALAPSGHHDDKSWPYFDLQVGRTVADAAKATLAILSPGSSIWRDHGDWQHSFRGETK